MSVKEIRLKRNTKRLIFYTLLMILPTVQVFLFYIYVNFNSIKMSLFSYNAITDTFDFVWFKNFADAGNVFGSNMDMVWNSLKLYLCNLIIVMGLALIFSYYISKNKLFSGFFRTILYLPHITSSIVFVLLYKYLTIDVSIELFGKNLLEDQDTQYVTVLFFNIWMGFGVNVMLFTGAMSGIDASIVESSHIDGVGIVGEFIYITIPMIWNTFITFVVVGLAGIFTNQMHLYTFFSDKGCEFSTFGYYFYLQSFLGAKDWKSTALATSNISYPVLSALGVLITLILVPLTMIVKKTMEKLGPSVD